MAHNPLKKLARYGNPMKWTNRYIFEKFTTQMTAFAVKMFDDASEHQHGGDDTKDMFPRLLEHAQTTSLCSQMVFGGEAMAPAITSRPRFGGAVSGGGGESSSGDGGDVGGANGGSTKPSYNLLLVRQLMYPEFVSEKRGDLSDNPMMWFPRRAHVGDVVAFSHPNPVDPSAPGGLLVRRVVALEGDVMESTSSCDDDEAEADADEDFVIPKGHAWVLADNEDMPYAEVPDSRTFGPLDLRHVVGRVVYALRWGVR